MERIVEIDGLEGKLYTDDKGNIVKISIGGRTYAFEAGLSRSRKAILGGEYALASVLAGAAGYGSYEAGMIANEMLNVGGAIKDTLADLVGKAFSSEDRNLIARVQGYAQQGKLPKSIAEQFQEEYTGYKGISFICDKGRADADEAFRIASEAAKKVTPPMPTDGVFTKLYDGVNKLRGAYSDPEAYAQNNIQVIEQRKNIYDAIRFSEAKLQDAVSKKDIEQIAGSIQTFHNAYSQLLSHEEMIKQGVERVTTTQLLAMQKEVDKIKPLNATDTLPIAAAFAGVLFTYLIIDKYIIMPTKWLMKVV